MKIAYQNLDLRQSTLAVIDQANAIINEYQVQGFSLTLRQLYYQFVSRGLIANKQSEYKRLGSIINDGRLAGLIDWSAIEDRGRNLQSYSSWDTPESIIESAAASYRLDLWDRQPAYVEVWVEKEALIGVISHACGLWRVPHFACKGYTSQSEMWEAGHRRLRVKGREGKTLHILHLGDHDPSGIDMTRDIEDRLALFARRPVEINRLALNMEQVEEWQPPPNPAKVTDSRFTAYEAQFGDESWELDALDPATLTELIDREISALVDHALWSEDEQLQGEHKVTLNRIAKHYEAVVDYLNSIEENT